MEVLYGFFVLLFIIAAYFLPVVIAARRNHKNFMPILLTDVIFGWTVIGWFVALIWSFSSNREVK